MRATEAGNARRSIWGVSYDGTWVDETYQYPFQTHSYNVVGTDPGSGTITAQARSRPERFDGRIFDGVARDQPVQTLAYSVRAPEHFEGHVIREARRPPTMWSAVEARLPEPDLRHDPIAHRMTDDAQAAHMARVMPWVNLLGPRPAYPDSDENLVNLRMTFPGSHPNFSSAAVIDAIYREMNRPTYNWSGIESRVAETWGKEWVSFWGAVGRAHEAFVYNQEVTYIDGKLFIDGIESQQTSEPSPQGGDIR